MPVIESTGSKSTSAASSSTPYPERFDVPDLVKVWDGKATLAVGARGLAVQRVQEALNATGHAVGGADGLYGRMTEAGLKSFQKKSRLPETGKIDQATLQALAKAVAKPAGTERRTLSHPRFKGDAALNDVLIGKRAIAAGSRGESVKKVQTALMDMGFYMHGGADGSYGAQTTKAVANFQRNASRMYADVKVTGKLDASTMRALNALAPARGKKGQTTNVPTPRYDGKQVRVVVVLNEHRTYLYGKDGKLQAIFPNAVGASGNATETGLKKITTKLDEKAAAQTGEYLWKDKTVFGTRILDLSWEDGSKSGEELHGTNAPARIGEDVSHGCVRHLNADIEAMFAALNVGDRVAIVSRVDDPRLGAPQR